MKRLSLLLFTLAACGELYEPPPPIAHDPDPRSDTSQKDQVDWTGSFTGEFDAVVSCPWDDEVTKGTVTLSLQRTGDVLQIPTLGCGAKADIYGSRATLRQTVCPEREGKRVVYVDGNLEILMGNNLLFYIVIRHEFRDYPEDWCEEIFSGSLYRPL